MGFVDAVVAAPSRKAALEAWGVHDNLFATGRATVVADPDLIARALETPGRIVRVPVGTDEAILKGAKPPPPGAGAPAAKPTSKARGTRKAQAPAPPPPDRSGPTKAEAELTALQARRTQELERLDAAVQALQEKRRERFVHCRRRGYRPCVTDAGIRGRIGVRARHRTCRRAGALHSRKRRPSAPARDRPRHGRRPSVRRPGRFPSSRTARGS